MARRARRRPERWFLQLQDEVRYLAVGQSARAVTERVAEAAAAHDVDPWDLTRMIARHWLAQGYIASLVPGEAA